jgi:hypothetical protein
VYIKYNNRIKNLPNGRFEILSSSETACMRAKKMLYDLEQDYLIIQQDKPQGNENTHQIQHKDSGKGKGRGRGRGTGRGRGGQRGFGSHKPKDPPLHFTWKED